MAKRNLQSELWVEPQHGVVCDSPPGLGYLKGLTYDQISSKVRMHNYDDGGCGFKDWVWQLGPSRRL